MDAWGKEQGADGLNLLSKARMVLCTAVSSLKEQYLLFPGEFQGMLEFIGCLMEGELESPTGPDFLFLKLSDRVESSTSLPKT